MRTLKKSFGTLNGFFSFIYMNNHIFRWRKLIGKLLATNPFNLKSMSNKELSLEQLAEISGGWKKEDRKAEKAAKKQKKKEEREHKKTCPDGKGTENCPIPVPPKEMEA